MPVRRLTRVDTTRVVSGETCIRSAVQGGVASEAAGGITDGGVSGGIQGTAAGGVQATVASAFQSTAPGGFQLAGGPSDWLTFSATRSYQRTQMLIPAGVGASGWTGGGGTFLIGPATTGFILIPITRLHHGATLTSVTMYFVVTGAHPNAPSGTNLPSMSVQRVSLAAGLGATLTTVTLASSDPQYATGAGSGPAWVASNHVQSWTYTCNQNNVIDLTNYAYYLNLTDENGANAVAGNNYLGCLLSLSGIPNMAFP